MNVNWMSCGGGNYGDEFTRVYLERLLGVDVQHTKPRASQLTGAGSIIHGVPTDYRGHVIGTGAMIPAHHPLPAAQIHSVRGPLTAKVLGRTDLPYGDLGVLAVDFEPDLTHEFELGVIPHYIDRDLVASHSHDIGVHVVKLVDIDPVTVIQQIARCDKIASSSLHALITADALGIPSLYVPHPQVAGNGFKFRDYFASVDRPLQGYSCADRGIISKQQNHARACLQNVVRNG